MNFRKLTIINIAVFLLVTLYFAGYHSVLAAEGDMTTIRNVPYAPHAIAFDGANMWIADNRETSVSKITSTGVVTKYKGTASYSTDIAFDGVNMWVTHPDKDSVSKISPTGAITIYPGTGAWPYSIAFDGVNMWTVNIVGNSVTKISPAGVMTTYSAGIPASPHGIAFDGTNMWVGSWGNGVAKISPSGVATSYTTLKLYNYNIAFDGTNMWASNYGGSLTKISPDGTMVKYPGIAGVEVNDLIFDGTNMWTVSYSAPDSYVSKMTPTGVVTNYKMPIPVNALITGSTGSYGTESPFGITFDGVDIWTANHAESVTKVTTGLSRNLSMGAVSVSGGIVSGQPITLVAPVLNVGSAQITSEIANIFQFDNDSNHTTAGTPVLGSLITGGIALNQTKNTTYSWSPTSSGTYYVRACTDNTVSWVGSISESNEGDNCSPWETIQYDLPDLVAFEVTPIVFGSVTSGVDVSLISRVGNTSTTSVAGSVNTIFQFADDQFGANAQNPVPGFTIVDGIDKSTLKFTNYTWTPGPAKDYWVRACVDNTTTWNGSVFESNEGNNCGPWSKITVTAPVSGACHTCPAGEAYTTANGCVPIKCPAGQKPSGAFCLPK